MVRSTLICVARNEARDIEEWVRFHRGIGFDRVVLYDHMSEDATGEIAAAAGAEVIDWREQIAWQSKAYNRSLSVHGADSEWLAFMDSDEFFVPVADGSVGGFLDRVAPHVGVAVPWRCYGSSGHVAFPLEPVTRAFTRRAVDDYSANRHVKVFVRPGHAKAIVNPHYFELIDGTYVHPDGTPVAWLKFGKTVGTVDGSIARINHYQVRSRAHYDEKLTRLSMKGVERKDRWAQIDLNDVEDPVIPRLFADIELSARS